MDIIEAKAWLSGERSLTNAIPQDPFDTWAVRIAEADAAMTQQAYWIAKAFADGLIVNAEKKPEGGYCSECGDYIHWKPVGEKGECTETNKPYTVLAKPRRKG